MRRECRTQQRLAAAKREVRDPNAIASVGSNIPAIEADLARRRKLLADYLNSPEYKAGVRAGIVPGATATVGAGNPGGASGGGAAKSGGAAKAPAAKG